MATTTLRSSIIPVGDLTWSEFRPGIQFKVLWEDAAPKRRAQMTRFQPGAQLPLHRHVGDELIYVIEEHLRRVRDGDRGERRLPRHAASTPSRSGRGDHAGHPDR